LGCLIGAFGAYPLLTSCSGLEGSIDNNAKVLGYGYTYEMIAQVVTACLVRMCLETLLRREEPRDLAVDRFKDMGDAFEATFKNFFAGDMANMELNISKCKGLHAQCEDLAGAVDPKLDVCPGKRVDFKVNLYTQLVRMARVLVSDVEMLNMAMKKWAPINSVAESQKIEAKKPDDVQDDKPDEETPEESAKSLLYGIMSRATQFKGLERDLMETLKDTFSVSLSLISQDTEAKIVNPVAEKLETLTGLLELEGVPEFYAQVNKAVTSDDKSQIPSIIASRRVRLTVATRSLRNATRHLGEMEALCLHRLIN